jgi:uncharacterized protein involved in exopolysaccharide biosynthesis
MAFELSGGLTRRCRGLLAQPPVHAALHCPLPKRVDTECSKSRARSSRQPPAAPVAVDFPADTGIDLRRILTVLWRGKATILWTTAASLLIAVMFVLMVPHRYTAMTQILIDPTDLHAVGNELTPTNLANDATVLQVESQVRVLTSDSVLRRVVKTEALDKDPEFAGQAGDEGTDSVAAALNALKRSIQVNRAERTYVVDVSVTTREPAKSARIANAIAEAYLQEQTDVRSDAVRQISQSLSSRLTELKERVRAAEDRVEAFKQRNNILGASGQLVNEQQLTEMNNQLSEARARTAAAKARLDQVQHVQLTKNEFGAFPEAVQSQTITALRSQYAEVMRREAEQMTSLGARHPAVIEIQAEAERLRRMVDDEVHRIAISARTEYESARANEETIAANLDKLKSNAMTTNEAMVTLRELERDDVQANRAVYEAFLVRARETGAQERLDTKNIRVISQADIPLRRSFPPSNLLLAVGAILFGMAAGGGIFFARETYGSGGDVGRDLRRDSRRVLGHDSELPRTGGTGVLRGRLTNAVRDFLPAGRQRCAHVPARRDQRGGESSRAPRPDALPRSQYCWTWRRLSATAGRRGAHHRHHQPRATGHSLGRSRRAGRAIVRHPLSRPTARRRIDQVAVCLGDQIARLVGSRHRARRHRQGFAGLDHGARRYRRGARPRFLARHLRCRTAFRDHHLGHYRPLYMGADVVQAHRRIDQSSAAIGRILSAEAAVVGDRLFLPKSRIALRPATIAHRGVELTVRSPN